MSRDKAKDIAAQTEIILLDARRPEMGWRNVPSVKLGNGIKRDRTYTRKVRPSEEDA